MLIKHSHILEARELQDSRVILCYIRIGNRSIKYYSGQVIAHTTHRWMQAEHWAKFDEHLEFMLSNQQESLRTKSQEFKEHTFWLNSSIIVRVSRCSISLDVLKRCTLDATDKWNITQAFEFVIENKEHEITNQARSYLGYECEGKQHEYNPEFLSPQSESKCVPYTPSTKIKSAVSGSESFSPRPFVPICQLSDEDRYSPKPIALCSSPQEINDSLPLVPTYTASPMKEGIKGTLKDQNYPEKEKKKTDFDPEKISNIHKKKEASESSEKRRKSDRDKYKNKQNELNNKIDENQKQDGSVKDFHIKIKRTPTNQQRKANKKKLLTQAFTMHMENAKRGKKDLVNENEYLPHIPRRSSSPIKTKGLELHADKTEIDLSPLTLKRGHRKVRTVTEDLFGSEDDEDKDFCTKTEQVLNNTSAQKNRRATTKNKRTRCMSPDTSSEKIGMDKWLGKKLVSKSKVPPSTGKGKDSPMLCISHDKRKNRLPKPKQVADLPAPASINVGSEKVSYTSKEVIEEQIKKEKLQLEINIKINEALNKLAGPIPEKVDTLTIKDLSLGEVLQSLPLYKAKLDEIFRLSAKNPHKIKGYNGVNHYLVMSLIDEKKRLAMMNSLREVYEPDFDGISAYATLYINAMMPEWIICIFMDKHKLSRNEAIKQVKAQDEYNLHLEAQLETTGGLE